MANRIVSCAPARVACLLCGWLIGLAAASLDAADAPPAAPVAVIQLADGDAIGGQLVENASENGLGWQAAGFAKPFEFALGEVNAVHFPIPEKLPPPVGAYGFELTGGDLLFGSLLSLDASEAVIEVADLGQLHVNRSSLRRMYRWNGGAELLFLGPSGLNGWQTSGPAKAWREEAGQLTAEQHGAALYRDFSLPAQARIEFELSWQKNADFELALGVGNDPKSELRAFRFEVWEKELVALRETEREADVIPLQAIPAGKGRIQLQAFLDQARGRMLVYSATGEQIAELSVASNAAQQTGGEKSTVLGGLRLTNKAGDVRLERLRIARWDGESPRAVLAGASRIVVADGSAMHGELKAYDAATHEFLVQDGEKEVRLAEAQIFDVVLSKADEKSPEENAATKQICAVQHSGLRASGQLLKVAENKVWLTCDGIHEPLGLPIESLHSLMVLKRQPAGIAPSGREGRLEIAGTTSHGWLVNATDVDASCIVWQPKQSRTTSPLVRDASARIVYRDPPAPPKAATRNRNQLLGMAVAVNRVGRVTVPETPQVKADAKPTTPILHLRSGDTIACTVTGISEQGISFTSTMTEATFVPHDQLKAIELKANAKPVTIAKLKKERLLMLPRMQRDSPPTQLIRSVEGDYLRGRLVEMNDKELRVEVRLETKTISRDKVARIIWLHADELPDAKPAPPTADSPQGIRVQALPNQGNRLTFFAQQLEGNTLSGKSTLLGGCRVDLQQVDQLLIGAAIEQSVATLAFHQWRLTPAAEPLTPSEEGEGSGDGSEGLESSLVGKPAPDFELELLDGKKFHLAEQKGKIIVLDFWASWCGPCLQVMPLVHEAAKEFADRDVVLVGVNLQEGPDRIKPVLERLELEMTVAMDSDGLVAEKYGATSIPQTVIIDREGKISRLYVGGNARFDETLRGVLEQLTKENAVWSKYSAEP